MTSNSLRLQQLEKEYEITMIQYKQAYLDYRNALQDTDKKVYKEKANFSNDYAWFYNIESNKKVKDIKECEALCSANSKCLGGTVKKTTNNRTNASEYVCSTTKTNWANGGWTKKPTKTNNKTKTETITSEYTAFMRPNIAQYKRNVDMLDSKLVHLNNEVLRETHKNPSDTTYQVMQYGAQNLLTSKYDILLKERKLIEEEEKLYTNLTNEYEDTSISVLQENTQNTMWIFITIIVVGITATMVIV